MATKIQVVFYSMYSHVYRLAEAVAAGAREVAGTEVSLYQVPELVPDEVLEKSGAVGVRACTGGPSGTVGRRRCDHLRHADPVR
jgi:NAD(P)H dehydrogenase (quinone)